METMVFSEINANKDGCCLVCHDETVYKVKVIFGEEVKKCDSAKLRLELEQVFRAVLHLSHSNKNIPPIYTQHLMVKPLKIYWAISEKIGFRQNGKDLETSSYFFQFHVSERPAWKTIQNNTLSGKKPISTRESHRESRSSLTSGGKSGELEENEGDIRNRKKEKHTSRKVNAVEETNCTIGEATGENVRARIATESDDEEIRGRGREDKGKDKETKERRKNINRKETDELFYTNKQFGRSAVTELSQSGVTDLDISYGTDSVLTNQQHNSRKKRKSYANVDDITGFSYKVNKFRAKISGGDGQLGRKDRHVLYRAGGCGRRNVHSPLMELPDASSSGETAVTVNKSKGNVTSSIHKTSSLLRNSTEQRHGLQSLGNTDRRTSSVARERSHTIPENVSETGQTSHHFIRCMDHDLSTDSHQCTTSTRSQTFRDRLRKRTMPHSDVTTSPTGSSLKSLLTRQSVLPKGQTVHTISSELSECRKSASISPAKNVMSVNRSVASSKHQRGRMRSETPLNGHSGRRRSETQFKSHKGRMRSATPLKGHKGRRRSETPSKSHRGRMRSTTPLKGHRGRMRSETPSKGHRGKLRSETLSKGHKGQTRSTTPSKGHIGQRMSASISPSKSNRRQLRSTAAFHESERLLRMQQPIQHGIQLTDVDRYLVEQEELQEVSKLQEMAATHDEQSCYYTRSQRKRSSLRLWDYVDSFIITPAKKIFKRM
ncbi:uncharacterized protein LOC117345272 [Pecten maximus]|uniref:uncharacterized protein LOC117345272 n=1 Tax=Pecten maximus TaxID=6579 RepID=UPI0014587E43|nr:uncharacterized protein LOC117345272 [Pecten maximus]